MWDQFGLRNTYMSMCCSRGEKDFIGESNTGQLYMLTTLKNVFSTIRPANASSLRATRSIATAPPID